MKYEQYGQINSLMLVHCQNYELFKYILHVYFNTKCTFRLYLLCAKSTNCSYVYREAALRDNFKRNNRNHPPPRVYMYIHA